VQQVGKDVAGLASETVVVQGEAYLAEYKYTQSQTMLKFVKKQLKQAQRELRDSNQSNLITLGRAGVLRQLTRHRRVTERQRYLRRWMANIVDACAESHADRSGACRMMASALRRLHVTTLHQTLRNFRVNYLRGELKTTNHALHFANQRVKQLAKRWDEDDGGQRACSQCQVTLQELDRLHEERHGLEVSRDELLDRVEGLRRVELEHQVLTLAHDELAKQEKKVPPTPTLFCLCLRACRVPPSRLIAYRP